MDALLLKRISVNPSVGHGKPTIRNSRYLVESILEYLAGGDSVDDLINEFPDLQKEDILACIAYATELLKFKDIRFIAA
jgi:uncharacterized protein (DUF433 family)